MSLRAQHLHAAADAQIAELTERLAAAGAQGLARPCPGREKLGDGTIGAVAAHTTDNYKRIVQFVAANRDRGGHHHPGQHAEQHRASDIELDDLLSRLAATRDALAIIGQLSDEQLDSVPTRSEMKFVDGARTLDQILASLLRHQRHQVDAVAEGLA